MYLLNLPPATSERSISVSSLIDKNDVKIFLWNAVA